MCLGIESTNINVTLFLAVHIAYNLLLDNFQTSAAGSMKWESGVRLVLATLSVIAVIDARELKQVRAAGSNPRQDVASWQSAQINISL